MGENFSKKREEEDEFDSNIDDLDLDD